MAAANGIVLQTGYNNDTGTFLAIQHKYGFMTRYFDMLRVATYKGAHVHRGDVIGHLGSTGLSTGPHVHYEVAKEVAGYRRAYATFRPRKHSLPPKL